jgi:hypothetical protein
MNLLPKLLFTAGMVVLGAWALTPAGLRASGQATFSDKFTTDGGELVARRTRSLGHPPIFVNPGRCPAAALSQRDGL